MPFTPIGPPRLTAAGRTVTGFRLQLTGEPGRKVEIQGIGDFTMWEPLADMTLGDQPFELEDAAAATRSQRFYRAVQRQ